MPLTFPSNPTPGQTSAQNGRVYVWSGFSWDFVAPASADGDKGDIVVANGGATWAIDSGVLSSFGRSLIDDADAAAARTTLGAVSSSDSRLTDSRTPTAHKASHATGGTDALTPADIGAASASHTHAASDVTSGSFDIARIPTGSTASTVCIGNDSRLSDSRTPTGAAGGDLTGTYPNPQIAAGAVVTADIANSAVTYAKIQNVSVTDRILGRQSAGAGVVEEITCTSFGRSLIDDADASTARTTLGLQYATAAEALGRRTTGTATANTSTLTVASSTGINNGDLVTGPGIQADTTVVGGGGTTTLSLSKATGAALSSTPVVFYRHDRTLSPGTVAGGMCRAWVNFNGTGTVAIRAAYNVTSITDNGVGNYTVNFGSDMLDTNYCVIANHSALVGDFRQGIQAVPSSITQATVLTYSNNAAQDPANVFVAIFR